MAEHELLEHLLSDEHYELTFGILERTLIFRNFRRLILAEQGDEAPDLLEGKGKVQEHDRDEGQRAAEDDQFHVQTVVFEGLRGRVLHRREDNFFILTSTANLCKFIKIVEK